MPPAPPFGAPAPPIYGGPVPPGGWQQPLAQSSFGEGNFALAGWGSRLGATLLDFLIIFAVSFVVGLIVGFGFGLGTVASDSEAVATAGYIVNILLGFAIYAVYTGVLMKRPGPRNGQTIGKQALGIRVVRTDGQPVTLGTIAIRHWLMKYVVFLYIALVTLYLATLLNYLWPLWDKEKRTFHDMVAGTRVVTT